MSARLADLMRQGFMKPVREKPRKAAPVIVACELCLNWHRKGKHTADAETRRARKLAARG